MRNRIVDSTWLGRGRHVLLSKCLRAQTTSKTRSRVLPSPRCSPRRPRLFIGHTRSHTSSLSLANVFTCSLARPRACSFTYPHTRRFFHSFPHSLDLGPRWPGDPTLSRSFTSIEQRLFSFQSLHSVLSHGPLYSNANKSTFPLPLSLCPVLRPNLVPT